MHILTTKLKFVPTSGNGWMSYLEKESSKIFHKTFLFMTNIFPFVHCVVPTEPPLLVVAKISTDKHIANMKKNPILFGLDLDCDLGDTDSTKINRPGHNMRMY